jgi:hypothetical protein
MRIIDHILAASFMFAAACSSGSTAPPAPMDHDVEGSWSQNTNGVLTPGSSFLVALHESGGVVVGTGTFAGEAAPFGAVAVSGNVAHDSLGLAIVFTANTALFPQLKPDTAQFVGALTTRDRIDGTLTQRNIASAFGLMRIVVGDPP